MINNNNQTSQTILLIDDDPALRSMLGFSLEGAGYALLEADCADSAIKQLTLQDIAVAILDMGMPPNEHSADEGLRVLSWLQMHQPQVNTVVLTGQNPDTSAYLALKHGAFDFLEKPVLLQTLLPAVKRAVLFYTQAQKLKIQEGLQSLQLEINVGEGVKSVRNLAEEKLVRHVLAQTQFNVHETARRLGIKRENVYYLINKYGLQRQNNE
ncbi:response regulator [Thiomicrorhabdus aquaedulcis]|uniref:response regulator n=1 Tax=Thiomicrorhabdus aquaedulcis TaxID=2211106 RepID=UPI000FDC0CE9|nr:response regulator [Thiomicrorhabdus aquaedulcis]